MAERRVGPYRVMEPLGAGGMGEVFLARDTRLGRQVALKRLTTISGGDIRQRVLREARAAATLNHPNIAAVYDVLESPDSAWIVMEFVAGETLSERIRRGALAPADAIEIGTQLCEAVAEAHANGIIHRDLKPANVRITPAGKVKVLDFGLAHVTAESSTITDVQLPDQTGPGRIAGTPPYMAPEQLTGQAGTERSDIYALGVVLYEMLAGHRPFDHDDILSLALVVGRDAPVSLTRVRPGISRELSATVQRALARRPQDRHESAAHFAADLRRLAVAHRDTPTTESDSGVVAPRRTFDRLLTKRTVATVVAAAALIAATAAGLFWRSPPSRRTDPGPPIVAVLPFHNYTEDAANDYLAAGFGDVLVSNLSRVPEIGVISRAATVKYRDRDRNPPRIARELGAAYIVDAGIQRSGEQIRVTASLMSSGSELVLWSASYDGAATDVFPLQRQLAEGLVSALQVPITEVGRQKLASVPTTDRDAFAEYAQGRTYLEGADVPGNIDRAVALFEGAVRRDPRFSLAHAGRAEAYWAKYQATKEPSWAGLAQHAIESAATIDPEQPQVRIGAARIYAGTGRAALAIDELRRAMSLQPANDEAHRLLGEILSDSGEMDAAAQAVQKAVALRPNYWYNHSTLGRIYLLAGRHDDAIAAYRRVTALQPESARGFENLGTAYHAKGDTRTALRHYIRATELGGTSGTYSNIGTLHYEAGRYNEAAAAYAKAIEMHPNEPRLYRNLGDAYSRMGRTSDARTAYTRAIVLAQRLLAVNPNDPATLGMLAVYEAKVGRWTDAEGHIGMALASSPRDAQLLYRKAVIFALKGDGTRALAALEQAISRGYSRSQARADDDFERLRDDPQFRRITSPGP